MLISERYIAKPWPNHELDILHRQHIEEQKKLFPIVHGVGKAQIDAWNPGLSGIVWLNSADGAAAVAEKIAKIVYKNSPTIGVVPSWENPQWRFLRGQGELLANTESGWAFNLFEAARFSDDKFPLYVYDRQYSKREIISAVASVLFYNNPDAVCLTPSIREEMLPLCKANGFDVEAEHFDAAVHCIH